MPVVAIALSILALPAGIAVTYGLSLVGQRLGAVVRQDRVTKKDQRWLADQE